MTQDVKTYGFGGGLDTNSAALAKPPGSIIGGENYEPLAEGYGRMQGFERFDGHLAPSAATYWTMDFRSGSIALVAGNVVVGQNSGASATIIAAPTLESGSWATGDAAGFVLFAGLSGTFSLDEPFGVAAADAATVDGTPAIDNAPDTATFKARRVLAQEWARQQIAKVPGSGPVRGVAMHKGTIYAWRNNVGGTALVGYKATVSGWSALPVLLRIPFTAGAHEIFEGDTVTGGTSGATATARRVVLQSGDWAATTGVGFVDLTVVAGTFAATETLKVGGVSCAVGSTPASVTLPAGGKVRWMTHNFYGASNLERIYAATGEGPGFEMLEDGAISTIKTGMAPDEPQRVFQIGNHLGFAFAGGSIQFSGTGEPHLWQVVLGAGEIGFGSDVTDIVEANQTAVAIFGLSKIGVLQGTDKTTFALDILTKQEAGAIPDTAQKVAKTIYLDARGLRSLDATQSFGNFQAGALSGRFERYLRLKRNSAAEVIGSFVCKSKSQYRIVWNDGTGLSIYMGRKQPEAMPFSFGDDVRAYCFGAGESVDSETLLMGGEDGYVYHLDSGNTLDGTSLEAYIVTAYNHFGNPVQEERFHKVAIETDAPAEATIGVLAQFDYAEGTTPDTSIVNGDVHGGGAAWNVGIYDDFYWSAPVSGRVEMPIDGYGRNASLTVISRPHSLEEPHVLQAYQVYRTPRRIKP